jgi:hypothetical protein
VANPPKLDKLSSELENRLDELFRENGPAPTVSTPQKAKQSPERPIPAASVARKAKESPLAELKKIVLSIDWEITPEALDSFLDQIRLLSEAYERDRVITMFLQVLGSLGHYIKSSRSQVHPSTFNVLNSVFARLDEVVSTPKMPEAARRKLLQAEMSAYQDLRGKILRRKAAVPGAKSARVAGATAEAPAQASGVVTPEMLDRAVAELKELIRTEIDSLRRLLRGSARRE